MVKVKRSILIVGADSLIGAGLMTSLGQAGVSTIGTSRRPDTTSSNRVFLDLADDLFMELEVSGFSCAFLCAGITSMVACEESSAQTRQINVTNTVRFAKRLLERGTRLVFLSSNTVFDGSIPWPDEGATCSPANEYGRQKAEVEKELLSLSNSNAPVAVVRLSKVLTPFAGMAADFLKRLGGGNACPAFSDLRLSPTSLGYTIDALLATADSNADGVFHLSGAEEMSYAELARRLAMRIGADPALVCSVPSTISGTKVLFRPEHPGIAMLRTQARLGIAPEPTDHLINVLTRKEQKN